MTVQEHLLFSGKFWGQWGDLIVPLSEWSIPPQPEKLSQKKSLIWEENNNFSSPKLPEETHFSMWEFSLLTCESLAFRAGMRQELPISVRGTESRGSFSCYCFVTFLLNSPRPLILAIKRIDFYSVFKQQHYFSLPLKLYSIWVATILRSVFCYCEHMRIQVYTHLWFYSNIQD